VPETRRAELDRGPQAPALARRAVAAWLAGALEPMRVEDAKLLVSELVTNAVRHPRDSGRVGLEVVVAGKRVRVEVSNPGAGFSKPSVDPPPADALGGRGLLIVDRLASRWGVTPGAPTRVWFEIDR